MYTCFLEQPRTCAGASIPVYQCLALRLDRGRELALFLGPLRGLLFFRRQSRFLFLFPFIFDLFGHDKCSPDLRGVLWMHVGRGPTATGRQSAAITEVLSISIPCCGTASLVPVSLLFGSRPVQAPGPSPQYVCSGSLAWYTNRARPPAQF